MAAMLDHNAIHLRQSQPRPFAVRLGGKERFKNTVQMFSRDAFARVRDAQTCPTAGRHINDRGFLPTAQCQPAQFKREPPP